MLSNALRLPGGFDRRSFLSPKQLSGQTRCIGWWESDIGILQTAGGAPASLSGDAIEQWTDLSGNGNHLFGSGSTAPTRINSVLGSQWPAVRFDGLDDVVLTTQSIQAQTQGFVLTGYILRGALTTGTVWGTNDISAASRYLGWRPRMLANTGQLEQRNADTADQVRTTGVNVALDTPYFSFIGSNGSSYVTRLNHANLTKTINSGADNGDWGAAITGPDNFAIGAAVRSTITMNIEMDMLFCCIIDGPWSERLAADIGNYFRFHKYRGYFG